MANKRHKPEDIVQRQGKLTVNPIKADLVFDQNAQQNLQSNSMGTGL